MNKRLHGGHWLGHAWAGHNGKAVGATSSEGYPTSFGTAELRHLARYCEKDRLPSSERV